MVGTSDTHLPEMSIISLLSVDVAWRAPLAAAPWFDIGFTVHQVDILKREGTRLVEEEPNNCSGSEIASTKYVTETE